MAAPSPAHVALVVVLVCVPATDSSESRVGEQTPAPEIHFDAGAVCLDAGWRGDNLDELIGVAVEILRRSGHDPEDYRLGLRMNRPPGTGFADRRVQPYPGVVFYPEDEDGRYPLGVDRENPCSVSWVWRPDRFTPWQRRVIVRAREVLREAWPGGRDEELAGVEVIETADDVTVRVSLGELDESGLASSRAEVTLRKRDLGAVD